MIEPTPGMLVWLLAWGTLLGLDLVSLPQMMVSVKTPEAKAPNAPEAKPMPAPNKICDFCPPLTSRRVTEASGH